MILRKIQLQWIMLTIVIVAVAGFVYSKQNNRKTVAAKQKNPCSVEFPKPSGYVNDFTRLFTTAEFSSLDSIVTNYEKETGNEIAIVTIDGTMIGKCDMETYSRALANEWKIGKKDKNNGVLICIAAPLRKMGIKTGTGIELLLTNEEAKYIIDSVMIPSFRNAQYFEGTKKGLDAIFKELQQDPDIRF